MIDRYHQNVNTLTYKNKNQELHWINYIKVVCMFLVYLNHSEGYSRIKFDVARHFYDPVFVNTFFVVSGYLLFRKQLSVSTISVDVEKWYRGEGFISFKNILFKLAIPSVLFASILFVPKVLVRGVNVDIGNFIHDTFWGGSMWFTSSLTISEILIFIFLLFRCQSVWAYLMYGVCCAIGSAMLFSMGFSIFEDPHLPWYYRSGLSAVLFMALGGLYYKYEDRLDTITNYAHGSLLWLLVFLYIIWGLFFYVYYSGSLFYPLNIPTVIIVMVGSFILIRLCKLLPASQLFDNMGRHSIGLYFFSGALPNIFAVLFGKVISNSVVVALITWSTSLLVAIPVVALINRYAPYLYDFRLIHLEQK